MVRHQGMGNPLHFLRVHVQNRLPARYSSQIPWPQSMRRVSPPTNCAYPDVMGCDNGPHVSFDCEARGRYGNDWLVCQLQKR